MQGDQLIFILCKWNLLTRSIGCNLLNLVSRIPFNSLIHPVFVTSFNSVRHINQLSQKPCCDPKPSDHFVGFLKGNQFEGTWQFFFNNSFVRRIGAQLEGNATSGGGGYQSRRGLVEKMNFSWEEGWRQHYRNSSYLANIYVKLSKNNKYRYAFFNRKYKLF